MSDTAVITKTPTMDMLIGYYVKVRDKKRELEAEHKVKLAQYNEMLERLEGNMLAILNAAGVNSMRAPSGTAFTATRTSAKVTDWAAALGYIKEHEAWDLLEARVNKTTAFAIISETQCPLPGVDTETTITVNIRRADASAAGK
jgi:hypothetical protein